MLSMTLTDCQKECCPLDTFVDVTKDMVPNDWAAECTKTHAASEHDYLLGELHLHEDILSRKHAL